MGSTFDKCCASERERPAQGQAPPDPDGATVGADEGEQMTPAEKLEVLKRASLTHDDGKGSRSSPTFTGKPEHTPEPRPVDTTKQEHATGVGEEGQQASTVPQVSGGAPDDVKQRGPFGGGGDQKTTNTKVSPRSSPRSRTSEVSNTNEGTKVKAARLLKSGLKTGEVGKLVHEHEQAEQNNAAAGATNVKKMEHAQEEDDLFEF